MYLDLMINKATYVIGLDAYPVTIIERSGSGAKIKVQYDDFKAGPNHDYFGEQKWNIIRNPNGRIKTFTRRKNGKYRPVGTDSGYLVIGKWFAEKDPSF